MRCQKLVNLQLIISTNIKGCYNLSKARVTKLETGVLIETELISLKVKYGDV